jgi:hypothetical protein
MEEFIGAIGHWLAVVAISGFLLIPVIFILGFLLQVLGFVLQLAMYALFLLLIIPCCVLSFFRELFAPPQS